METMKAVCLQAYGGFEQLAYRDVPIPQPKEGEVLVRVQAAAITPSEFTWISPDRAFPIILGHELSGVVAALGSGVVDLAPGDEVYGLPAFARDGAQAEYVIALPNELASKPRSIGHVQAAEVPISALTAWQALFDHAHLRAGQRVLIYGATGGVGAYAVQLAKRTGAHVVGTASTQNVGAAKEIGADEVVDYTAVRFEEVIHDIDLVLDTVGGETEERSWGVLKPGGLLISVVTAPSEEQAAAQGARGLFFIVEPSRTQLTEIGQLIDAGELHPLVETTYPIARAREAYAHALQGHIRGKVVLWIGDV